MDTLRRWKPLLSAFFFALVLVAINSWSHADDKSGGSVIRVGLNSGADTFDPALSTQLAERYIMYAVYDTLVQYDKDFNIKPALAISWSNPNPLTYVLKLREGVKFQDGTPFDADVVKWNIDRILDPATKSSVKSLLGSVKSVEVISTYEVRLNLQSPAPGLLSVFGERPGFMVSPTAVKNAGEQFGRNPVGTGPFKLTEWVKDDHITLTRWDGYWDKSETFADKIVFNFVLDTTVREQMLRTNHLDIIDDVLPADIPLLKRDPNIKVGQYDSMTFIELGLKTDQPPFNSRELRQAISYAIDRQQIVDLVTGGNGKPGRGPLPAGWAANPDLKAYDYNPEKTKELLKKAGVPDNFSFVITVSATPLYQKLGEIVQQQLKKVGLDAQIKPVDYSQHYTMQRGGNTYAFIERWTPRADPGVIMNMHFDPKGMANNQRYENNQVTELITGANSTYDQAKRKALLQQAEQLVLNDAPMVWIYYPSITIAMRSNLQGYEYIPDGIIRVRNLKIK
jgi:peptide/nickel transport system substrate-binding protein